MFCNSFDKHLICDWELSPYPRARCWLSTVTVTIISAATANREPRWKQEKVMVGSRFIRHKVRGTRSLLLSVISPRLRARPRQLPRRQFFSVKKILKNSLHFKVLSAFRRQISWKEPRRVSHRDVNLCQGLSRCRRGTPRGDTIWRKYHFAPWPLTKPRSANPVMRKITRPRTANPVWRHTKNRTAVAICNTYEKKKESYDEAHTITSQTCLWHTHTHTGIQHKVQLNTNTSHLLN